MENMTNAANKCVQATRRPAPPPGAGRQFGRALQAPPCSPAAVVELCRCAELQDYAKSRREDCPRCQSHAWSDGDCSRHYMLPPLPRTRRLTAAGPLEQFGEIAKGISHGNVGRNAESAGLTMNRAERIVPLKAAPLLRCGAASWFLSASLAGRSFGAGGCRPAPRSGGCGWPALLRSMSANLFGFNSCST